MGAAYSCLIAGVFPERVKWLVLIENLGPIVRPVTSYPSQLKTYIQEMNHISLGRTPSYNHPQEAILARMKANHLNQEAAESLVMRNLKKTENGYSLRTDSNSYFIFRTIIINKRLFIDRRTN